MRAPYSNPSSDHHYSFAFEKKMKKETGEKGEESNEGIYKRIILLNDEGERKWKERLTDSHTLS